MKWQNREIATLTDTELIQAKNTLTAMLENYQVKKLDIRWEKRHKVDPPINNTFVEIKAEVETEIKKRKI